jgi:ubiquitin-protein ligase
VAPDYSAQTPYQGGVFRMKLVFGPDFPAAPPKGYFITPIFHPNVSKSGEICVNTLKKDWRAECKLSHILMVTSDALNFMLTTLVDYRIDRTE